MSAEREIRVRIPDEPGALGRVSAALGRAGINIRGFGVWGGLARLLVSDVGGARAVLDADGFESEVSDVLILDVPDEPGNLAELVKELGRAGVNIDYTYSVTPRAKGVSSFVLAVIDTRKAEGALAG